MDMKRMPAVAGRFYKGSKALLTKEIESLTTEKEPQKKENALGIICPHAGLVYSGAVAGAVYSKIEFPETIILLGPNHTGMGDAISIMTEGQWEIPTQTFNIDTPLAQTIVNSSPLFKDGTIAHLYEHSIEVQLPFIARFSSNVKIVPITIIHASLKECKEAGSALSSAIKQSAKKIVIAASTDMSHYLSDKQARIKDKMAIDKILTLDPEGLYNIVISEKISMCGYIPTAIMLYAVKALGAKETIEVKYTTSAEVSGDYNHVVGYFGAIIK
ncbi:Memo-like domain protein [Candidatus Magnetoovum chiemensis]|nr:Memo-like domain protein [Candidatus Magnetoovum chiemensis]